MTQLAKEFLKIQRYFVDTNIKVPKHGNNTLSDADIVAYRNISKLKGIDNQERKILQKYFKKFSLSEFIVGEVKTYNVDVAALKEIYKRKFGKSGWDRKFFRQYGPLTQLNYILFCRNVTKEALDVAKTYRTPKMKIITAPEMLKAIVYTLINKELKSNTYDPEMPLYTTFRNFINFLSSPKEGKKYVYDIGLSDILINKNNFFKKEEVKKTIVDAVTSSRKGWYFLSYDLFSMIVKEKLRVGDRSQLFDTVVEGLSMEDLRELSKKVNKHLKNNNLD